MRLSQQLGPFGFAKRIALAHSGYAALEWRGKGSLNETSGLNRTPDSQAMFAATTKKSWLLTAIADTCDVLEEAVNTAFERPSARQREVK